MTRLCLILLTFLSAVPAVAQEDRGVIERLLVSKRGFPTAVQLHRVGNAPDVNRTLTEIAYERTESTQLRLNAIRALEYFPTRRTEEVLMTMLYAREQKASFKAIILRSLARTFGVNMYFEILPFMRDKSSRVRRGAAIAMGEIDDGRVRGILANHLVHEQEIDVRLAIEKAVGMIDVRERRKAQEEAREFRE